MTSTSGTYHVPMALFRYTDPELRVLLARCISVRWPRERIFIVTPCEGDPPGAELVPASLEAAESPGLSWAQDSSEGVLAATQSRLVYQERLTHTVLIRSLATLLALVAVATLFFGDGLFGFAILGCAALILRTVGKFAEVFSMGRTAMEFERIESVDHLGQQIYGSVDPGRPFRLRVLDPSDFRVILSLVTAHGQAAA